MNSPNLTVLKLTEAAKAIAAGHFDARVVVTMHDDTDALADAFNQMADTLEQNFSALRSTNDELEHRIAGRTLELTAEIAERKRTEKELHQLHRQHQLVLNGAAKAFTPLTHRGGSSLKTPFRRRCSGGKPAN